MLAANAAKDTAGSESQCFVVGSITTSKVRFEVYTLTWFLKSSGPGVLPFISHLPREPDGAKEAELCGSVQRFE
jgi:hypothetical protein